MCSSLICLLNEPVDIEKEIIKDLSFSLEEVEIDDSVTEPMKVKRKMMDAKIEEEGGKMKRRIIFIRIN